MARLRSSFALVPRVRLWPGLPPDAYVRSPLGPPTAIAPDGAVFFARARHALWHGLRAAGLEPGDEVLTPAYHCGAEVEAVARAGLRVVFYEAADDLQPDPDELENLLGPRARALLLIHYFGFPQNVGHWRGWCDDHGLLLIEDCAHALNAESGGRPVGSLADVAIFSFAKTLPLPDGAALVSRTPVTLRLRRHAAVLPLLKRHAQWAMARSALLDGRLARFEREDLDDMELGDPSRAAAHASQFLLRRFAVPKVAERRRAHYRLLLEAAGGRTPRPFATLPDGAAPLVFPLKTDGDAAVLERLARTRVEARPFWPATHPLLPADRFPGAVAWRRRFVALPVHQELRARDLERIARALDPR